MGRPAMCKRGRRRWRALGPRVLRRCRIAATCHLKSLVRFPRPGLRQVVPRLSVSSPLVASWAKVRLAIRCSTGGPIANAGLLPSSHVSTGCGRTSAPSASSCPVPTMVDGAPEHMPAKSSRTTISKLLPKRSISIVCGEPSMSVDNQPPSNCVLAGLVRAQHPAWMAAHPLWTAVVRLGLACRRGGSRP